MRATPEQLAGMPEDWLAAHPADEEGCVTVTTDYPDAVPARMFVHDADVRRQVTVAFLERGWPQNEPLLKELFDLRHEYANLVGYGDWASYDAAVKMIEKGPAIPEFIDRIAQAAQEPMERDLAVVMERYRAGRARRRGHRRAPTRRTTRSWSARSSTTSTPSWCAPTSRSRRSAQGLLDVTGRLFGLRYEPAADAVVWHEDVAAYDVYSTRGRATARASAGSTSTCTRARASTSTPRSSRSPTASPAGSCPRARWSATSARG